jgi:hypothetical protein
MSHRRVDFDVDFAALLAPGLTSANEPIAVTKYRLLPRTSL